MFEEESGFLALSVQDKEKAMDAFSAYAFLDYNSRKSMSLALIFGTSRCCYTS